jgi:hypothetical protein
MNRTVIYQGKPYIVIEDNGSGLLRIAETEVKSFGQVTGYTGDIRYVEKDEISEVPVRGNLYTTIRENIEKVRMKPTSNCCNASIIENSDLCSDCGEHSAKVEALCEFCSDPIYVDQGRRRIGGKDYHFDDLSDCFMESVKLKAESKRVVEICAEAMTYDKRIAG